MRKVFVYPSSPDVGLALEQGCYTLIDLLDFESEYNLADADLALAPCLRRRLSTRELATTPTLVFHPSILPYRRGPDAVHWTIAGGDRVGGVTWFWADEGLDTGDICEQEAVVVPRSIRSGAFYHGRLIPAGIRALARALEGIRRGVPRRVPQDPDLATYDGPLAPRAHELETDTRL